MFSPAICLQNAGIGAAVDLNAPVIDTQPLKVAGNVLTSGAQLVMGAMAGPAALGASTGGLLANIINPIGGIVSGAAGLISSLLGGNANSQVGSSVANAVNNALGGDVGQFLGGLLGGGLSAIDAVANLGANLLSAVGVDTGDWFSDSLKEGQCARPTVTIEDVTYSGVGPDRNGNPYIWHGCDNDHDDVRFQNNANRFVPGTGKPLWGREYTRGLISAMTPEGWQGWQDYALLRWSDKSLSVKDSAYYSSGYATADLYNRHLAAMRRVRVPNGKVLLDIVQHGGIKIADAEEKHADALTYQDVAALIHANALPAWLALEIATGKLVPLGDPTAADLSNIVTLGAPNTYSANAANAASHSENSQSTGVTGKASSGSFDDLLGLVLPAALVIGGLLAIGGAK